MAGHNFSVHFEGGGADAVETGFAEVVFPDFTVPAPRAAARTRRTAPGEPAAPPHLLLRRGVSGSLDLYRWFDQARNPRRGKPLPGRTVTVRLLADDQATVVMTWRFSGARPVRIAYSPLRANAAEIVIETLELAFDRVHME